MAVAEVLSHTKLINWYGFQLVSDTRKVFKSGRTLEVSWRLNQLKNLLRMIEEQRDAMVAALKKDLNKVTTHTLIHTY